MFTMSHLKLLVSIRLPQSLTVFNYRASMSLEDHLLDSRIKSLFKSKIILFRVMNNRLLTMEDKLILTGLKEWILILQNRQILILNLEWSLLHQQYSFLLKFIIKIQRVLAISFHIFEVKTKFTAPMISVALIFLITQVSLALTIRDSWSVTQSPKLELHLKIIEETLLVKSKSTKTTITISDTALTLLWACKKIHTNSSRNLT